jgi:hypothetical protein
MLTAKLYQHKRPPITRNNFPTELCSKWLAIYSVQSDICSTEKRKAV